MCFIYYCVEMVVLSGKQHSMLTLSLLSSLSVFYILICENNITTCSISACDFLYVEQHAGHSSGDMTYLISNYITYLINNYIANLIIIASFHNLCHFHVRHILLFHKIMVYHIGHAIFYVFYTCDMLLDSCF